MNVVLPVEHEIRFEVTEGVLAGTLAVPAEATSIVVFAHGSGSSRFSRRNRFVAHQLNAHGFGTLLMDLLTDAEERIDLQTMEFRFDVAVLGDRLVRATNWIHAQPNTKRFGVGYFGASTGAAAALIAAAELGDIVDAVVSRGGRPDLAGYALERVVAPTLLIVGGNDLPVIGMNREAMTHLHCHKELTIVPGATHLFEEHGALERVSELAIAWFGTYCRRHA